ncbi:unnamed protein product [Darwinula stevensoni]|uniref:Sulfotransferase domain-containing protein n=1 Tax=Darwinula stevensoni TaxID=69355 RepID=A0A7R8X8F6_9CRUS|nr:unnamed protein product [Darwinula stevensoni]CAG0888029.1 unnamed protein product [Darwinula stevensoni]
MREKREQEDEIRPRHMMVPYLSPSLKIFSLPLRTRREMDGWMAHLISRYQNEPCERQRDLVLPGPLLFSCFCHPSLIPFPRWIGKLLPTSCDNGVSWQDQTSLYGREKPYKILLFAYPRSGSSLVGSLLSAANLSWYYFEPLFFVKNWDRTTYNYSKRAEEILESLFHCDLSKVDAESGKGKAYENWKIHQGFADPPCVPSQLDYIVQKVIRLPATHHVMDWLERNPDILVIHLVRDPRGIVNSIQNQPNEVNFKDDSWEICDRMWRDILAIDSLSRQRRRRVRYEDVVENPLAAMEELYDFMNIPYTKEVEDRIEAHFDRGESGNQILQNKYFSTYRNMSAFDPEHWRSQLEPERIAHIEEMCGHVLQDLGYPVGDVPDLE